ncbi:MAG: ARMT1-like domain-containing protein [Candidatus Gastranaerophilales bacterium]|nr:ARMT1-like domain-containing protein [Candidatus Gastranaerophilales bacterium]
MKTHFDCVPCMINSILNVFKSGLIDKKHQENVIRAVLKYYSEIDYNVTPLKINRDLHRLVREISYNQDPYKEVKDKFNQKAISYYDEYKNLINTSKNPFQIALKLAIAGNIIDFGPTHDINIEKTIETVLSTDYAINHSAKLFEELKKAKKVLYLGDNTGEIVFDKLFIETINHPNLTYAVRQSPILNDSTMEDVKLIGIDKIANIITNGDNAPGTLLEAVSDEFLEYYNNADLIISKGQGNYEGLNTVKNRNIYFLLMAKCNIIAKDIGVKKGDFIVFNSIYKLEKNNI